MKEITVIMEEGCPYCEEAEKLIQIVQKEYPAVHICRIGSDTKESEPYDFYFLPAGFVGERRVFHGACTEKEIRRAFEEANQDKAD